MRPDSSRPFEVTHRGVLAIAVPMTLAYLSTPLVGVVNLGVIGQLGDPALVGGVSIGALVFDVVFITFNFLRAGTTGLVAQAFGAGSRTEIAAVLMRALLLAIGIGALVVALAEPLLRVSLAFIGGSDAVQAATAEYWHVRALSAPFALVNYAILGWLIGIARAGYGLALQIVLNGLNMALSLLLVHTFGMGVAGVAWASVVAETATAALGVVLAWRLLGAAAWPGRRIVFNGAAFLRMIAVNRDIMIRSFVLQFAFAFFTARSADGGDVVLAANEILINLTMLAAFLLDGLAAAAEQYAGRAVGARYRDGFVRSVRLTALWGYAVAVVVSLGLWFAGPLLLDLMTTSEPVRAAGLRFLPFAALVPLVGTLAYQMDGVFIGATWSADMRNMMLLSAVVYLAVWWLLTPVIGITGLWVAFLVFLGVRGLSLLLRIPKKLRAEFAAA